MATKPARSTSLKELGYSITSSEGKDPKGNDVLFTVVGPAPTYFIKQTKGGRLFATRTLDATVESTIEGLYNFEVQEGDLVGKRATSTPSAKPAAKSTTEPVKAA